MSYPSIVAVCQERGVADLSAVTESAARNLLWEAFQRDLPLGIAYLREVASEVLSIGKRVMKIEDPNSVLGKQIARLLGADVARSVCAANLGVAFGLYNCCVTISAPTPDGLNMNAFEQIDLQNGKLANADC